MLTSTQVEEAHQFTSPKEELRLALELSGVTMEVQKQSKRHCHYDLLLYKQGHTHTEIIVPRSWTYASSH